MTGGTKVISRSIVAAIFSLSACGSQGQHGGQADVVESTSAHYVVDSAAGSLRGIYVDMSQEELSSLGYPTSTGSVVLEGDEYTTVDVELDEQIVIEGLIDFSGHLYQFSTTSESVRDERGVGVGTSLLELRQSYPEGRLFVGDEDGRYASFVNGSKVIFFLEKDLIDDACFDEPSKKCEVNDQVKVEKLVVNRFTQ